MKVRVDLVPFRSKCNNCNHEFLAYDLPETSYGERIMLSEDGLDYAYINCVEDTVFEEVSELISVLRNDHNPNSAKNIDSFNKVFGYACDKLNGKIIDAHRTNRACLICGSGNTSSWGINPLLIETKEVFLVTHSDWFGLSITERKSRIRSFLKLKGCI